MKLPHPFLLDQENPKTYKIHASGTSDLSKVAGGLKDDEEEKVKCSNSLQAIQYIINRMHQIKLSYYITASC